MRAILAALTLFATAPNSSAEPQASDFWFVTAGQNSAGRTQVVVFMDANRITTTSASVRRGWTTAYIAPDAVGNLAGVWSMQSFKEFDCAQGLFRDIQMNATYRDDRRGQTYGATDWEYAAPNTSGETALRFACASEAERLASGAFYRLDGMSPEQAAQEIFDAAPDQ